MPRITAYKLAKLKLLRGKTGKILTDYQHVQNLISTPGLFKSYTFEPTPQAPNGAHTVTLEEVDEWNKNIETKLAEESQRLDDIKPE